MVLVSMRLLDIHGLTLLQRLTEWLTIRNSRLSPRNCREPIINLGGGCSRIIVKSLLINIVICMEITAIVITYLLVISKFFHWGTSGNMPHS
ncbi:hypothetical protein Hanom_Chr12g01136231 [Helianthus anomalus]